MKTDVQSCLLSDSLNRAAQIMWERDCGCVPIVDDRLRVIGIITDRDVCMGAYTQGRPLSEIRVSSVCTYDVQTCRPGDSLARAEEMMIERQVRRLPVTDTEDHLLGILSLSDLTRYRVSSGNGEGSGPRTLALVMGAVSRPRKDTPIEITSDEQMKIDEAPE